VKSLLRITFSLHGDEHSCTIERTAIVGRLHGCDVCVVDDSVSRRHASLSRSDSGWTITDLDSSNGLFVNEARVEHAVLRNGDVVRVGTVDLRCELETELAPHEQVVLDDTYPEETMTYSIDMERFDTLRDRACANRRSAPTPSTAGGHTLGAKAPAAAATGAFAAERGEAANAGRETEMLERCRSLIQLFNAAAETLLASDDLDRTLEKVMALAFDHLPAERGFIGLCADSQARPIARVVRMRSGAVKEPIRISSRIADSAMRGRQAVLVEDAPSDVRFNAASSVADLKIHSAMCAPLCYKGNVGGIVYVDTQNAAEPFTFMHLQLLSSLASLSAVAIEKARMSEEIRREHEIRTHLARYHAPAVVSRIVEMSKGSVPMMASEELEVTVLFFDLCGFTALSDSLSPAEATRLLNDVLSKMTAAVFQFDGTLDKFTGDGMMVFFGAPFPQPDHAVRAVGAALAMQALLAEFNASRPSSSPLWARIGINTGPAIAGDIGAPHRMDYTVIGDTVNVASRLESSVAKPGWIVIGPATHTCVRERFACEGLPSVQLRGKSASITPFRVLR
jgi:adenylate cyclase